METLGKNKWVICRICLRSCPDEMHKIFTEDADVDLVGKIRECGGITLYNVDNLPDSICSKCLLLLKLAYKFRTLCQKSHQQLSNVAALSDENSEGIEALKTNNGNIALAVKLEVESTQEEYSNEVLHSVMESDINEEINAESFVEIEELQEPVGYIELAESSQNDDAEYLQDGIEDFVISGQSNLACSKQGSKIDNQNESSMHFREHFIIDGVLISDSEVKNIVKTVKQRKRRTRSGRTKKKTNQVITMNDEGANFICFHCGNIYAERSKLTLHLKMHNKEKPHECEICHKHFAQTPQLSRHMNTHTGYRPYKCKFCTSSFADPSTCIKHERIHTNERPYKCGSCDKAFSYSNVLKVHMMTHTGEKPYSCEYCGKKFAQLHHKKAHERTHNVQPVLKLEKFNYY